MSEGDHPGIVGGLFEAFHAVDELAPALRYWEAFGYRIGADGRLDAAAAKKLYGVDMALRSVRLQHQSADHGLVRLMMWDGTLGAGLGIEPVRGLGTRWTGQKTLNMARIFDQARAADSLGREVRIVEPFFVGFTPKDKLAPFLEAIPGVREMVVLQPRSRQVFIEFIGWNLPHYGSINPNCLLQTSQFTHQCLMVQDDSKKALDFYDGVLGMVRLNDSTSRYTPGSGANTIFDLAVGEDFHVTDFDDPRATNEPTGRRSGRLKIIRLEEGRPAPDLRDRSRPGHYGMTGYSLRVRNIDTLREKVSGAGASAVTDIVQDEFGARAFSFDAPDGNFWTAIAA